MRLPYRTSQLVIMLNILGLLLPFNSILGANPAVPTPTQQQTNEVNKNTDNSDRSGSSGAAQAMAAMGAGMAMLGCVMGLKAAQEEPDPAQKQMMQSMAMQQCGQAAQNAASAAQNGDQKKKLDGGSPQMTATPFDAPEVKVPEDGKEPDLTKLSQGTKTTSTTDTKEPAKTEPFEKPPAPQATKTASLDTKSAPIPDLKASKSVPQMVEPDTITTKKDSPEDGKNQGNEAVKALGSALAGKGSADDLLKKALAENGANPNDSAMIRPSSRGSSVRKDGVESEGSNTSGPSSSSSSGESNSNSPFDALLAQMMGGGQPGALPMGYGGDSDLVYVPKSKEGRPKLNIFQFASTVYSELSRSQNRIAKQPIKSSASNSRIIGSEPNLVTKALAR